MKVICDRGALVDALNLTGAVVVARSPKPVLTCVKLSATEGSLAIAATDLEVALRLTTPRVEVSEPGDAVIPADKFAQIVRESVDSTITLEADDEAAHIRGQDSHFKILTMPAGDFPPVPVFDGEADFEVEAGQLQKLLTQTLFATARENSRYAINGVLIERQAGKLTVVATDGRRLALAKGTCQSKKSDNRSAIVPTKALGLLIKLFDNPEETVRIRVADNQILFAGEQAVVVSNLVEGSFPAYQDVIPRDADRKATLDTTLLTSAVRRASLLTNEESKGVKFSFTSNGLTLTSRAPEMGEAEVSMPVARYDGETIDIGFNPAFVVDVLKVVDANQVTFEFKAANKPGVLRTGPEFLYVLMPVSLQ